MAQKSKAEILFLFEDEIRTASAALAEFIKINDLPEESRNPEAFQKSLTNALSMCHTALHGANDPKFNLFLCKANIFKPVKE